MKAKIAMLLLCTLAAFGQTVTINGYAFLEGETAHDSIEVVFERTVPSPLSYTTFTNAAGYYIDSLEAGIYNVTYSKTLFGRVERTDVVLYSSTTLPDTTLPSVGLIGEVYGILESGSHEVLGDIYVPVSETLIIQPGVTIEFMETAGITVFGVLIAEGSETDSIVFTKASIGPWEGITISHIDVTSRLSYCLIEHCDSSAIHATGYFKLENSLLRNCGYYAIYTQGALIKQVHITNNYGCILSNGSNLSIERCLFDYFIGTGIILNNKGTLENSIIVSDSAAIAIDCYRSVLINNTIINRFPDCASAIGIKTRRYAGIINCIIANFSDCGVFIDYGEPEIAYCCFWGNTTDVSGDTISEWLLENVTVNANGDSCDPWQNIELNPMFEDTLSMDYRLTSMSACLDAGTESYDGDSIDDIYSPLEDFDGASRPYGPRWDIGAYEGPSAGITEQHLSQIPNRISLSAYPNPFNSAVRIAVEGDCDSPVRIEIYDVAGRKVESVTELVEVPGGFAMSNDAIAKLPSTGSGSVYVWQPASSLPSGIYLVRAVVSPSTGSGTVITKRVVYLK